jgi:ribosomal protein S18 acetylase RimI-like enzyme
MSITYNTIKDLPSEQLHKLFMSVGWSDGTETLSMLKNFNMPFINSAVVISAWENDYLVGCVRVLSDKIVRSVIYDLAITPEFQNQGIGKELIRRCIEHFPDSEWLIGTIQKTSGYYEKIGFKVEQGVFLSLSSKWF